jgi:hypothetical protein
MQFISTILALGLATSSALAAPGAGVLEPRAGSLTVKYYSNGNCEPNTYLGNATYTDADSPGCQEPVVGFSGIRKFSVVENTLDRESRFFSRPGCLFQGTPSGQYIAVAPGATPTCFSLDVQSFDVSPYVQTE